MQFKMPTCVMKIYKIRIITTPNISKGGGFMPSYKVFCKYTQFYDSYKHQKPEHIKGVPHSDFIPTFVKEDHDREPSEHAHESHHSCQSQNFCKEFDVEDQVLIYDDVKIEFYQGKY